MKTFSVIEYSSFFSVRHDATGEEYPMGDGIDTVFDTDDNPLLPGSEGFVEAWEDSLNANEQETMEAYFPDWIDPNLPEEGDWVTGDHETFYEDCGEGVIRVREGEDWRQVVKDRMQIDQFWPNVWFISDHGNAHTLSLED